VNEFDSTGGGSGTWFSDALGKLLDYKAKTSQTAVRWGPYGADGTQFGVLPDGSLIQRGTPAPNAVNSGLAQLSQLVPILLLAAIGFAAYRALR
jgi:hypothetical protein